MASLGIAGILSLAGSAASAVGTLAGSSSQNTNTTTGWEGTSEALQAIQERMRAGLITSNSRLQNMFSAYNTKVQQANVTFAGRQAEAAGAFNSKQLRRDATFEKVVGQQEMFALRRQGDLALSDATAKAAASGFTATDEGSLNILGDIAQWSSLQEKTALFGGLNRAAGLEGQASAALVEGQNTRALSDWQSQLIGGQGELERMVNKYSAAGEARAAKFNSSSYKTASRVARSTAARSSGGSQSKLPAYLSAAGTLAGAAGGAYAKYSERTSNAPRAITPLK